MKSYTPKDLDGFKAAQRLGFKVATEVSKQLKPGMTEREVAELLRQALIQGGTRDWFHAPFAWFGDRSGFLKMRGFRSFLPTNRKLESDDVVILDVAPILNGYVADIGYVCSLEPNPELDRAKETLRTIRNELPKLFEAPRTLGEIWTEVDRMVAKAGFKNSYQLYPFSVLGHRVMKTRKNSGFGFSLPFSFLSWFGVSGYIAMITGGIKAQLVQKRSSQSKLGLWAIEPHLSNDRFGAKFEEILVVEEARAYWLDSDVPHMQA